MLRARNTNNETDFPQVESLIDWLAIGALVLGLITILMDGQMLAKLAYVNVEYLSDGMTRTTIYKLLKLLEVFCVLSAGFLAFWTEERFRANRLIKWALFILLAWMSGHALITFRSGFSPFELISQKGPVVWWSLFFLFVGFSKERWKKLYPVILLIVFIGSIEIIFRIQSVSGTFDRVNAQRTLRMSLRLLMWSAPLLFLVSHKNIIYRFLSVIPLVLISIAALMTGTRSWLMVSFLYFIIIIFSEVRRAKRLEAKVLIVYFTFFVAPLAFYINSLLFHSQVHGGLQVLFNRLMDDSRSGQLAQFFAHVSWSDLSLGTGPRGTWTWGSYNYGYVDGVYFFLLFLGGVPLLLPYIYLVVAPPFRVLFKRNLTVPSGSLDFACITMAAIWGLVLTGLGTYTIPELKIHHYIVLLCAGRCWSLLLQASPVFFKNRSQFQAGLNTASMYRRADARVRLQNQPFR